MRTLLAVVIAVVMLFVGVQALGVQSAAVQDAAVENGTNTSADAYNMTNQIYEGTGQAFAPGLVWMGIAAAVLVALGLLVSVAGGGR